MGGQDVGTVARRAVVQPLGANVPALSAAVAHLPDDRQRLWVYFKLWPNVAFDIYPDQIDFMQFVRSRPPRR